MPYVLLCVCFLDSTLCLRDSSIFYAASVFVNSFFWSYSIFLDHYLLVHLSILFLMGIQCCFQFEAITNSAAICSMFFCVSACLHVSIGNRTLWSSVCVFSVLVNSAKQFFKVTVPKEFIFLFYVLLCPFCPILRSSSLLFASGLVADPGTGIVKLACGRPRLDLPYAPLLSTFALLLVCLTWIFFNLNKINSRAVMKQSAS